MEKEVNENPLLKEIKRKYDCFEVTADTAPTPEDVGIIMVQRSLGEGSEYVGAIREVDDKLFYCSRRIGGLRASIPLTNLHDLKFFSLILHDEYEKLGVSIPLDIDLKNCGQIVKDGLTDFILSYGAVRRKVKERYFYNYYEEIVLWDIFKFSFVCVESENAVDINIHRTDDKDYNESITVTNILDGVRWIAQQLKEYVQQLKENVNRLSDLIEDLTCNNNGWKYSYPYKK